MKNLFKKITLRIKKWNAYWAKIEKIRMECMIKSGRGMWIILILLSSCTKENIDLTPCMGDCETSYEVIYKNQLLVPNIDNFYEVEWDNLNYFQISGYLTPLNEEYEINNVPLIEARFDSDYWVVLDSLTFQTPMYSYLGWFNDNTLNNPIAVGNYDITLIDMIDLHPPFNVVGYQIPRYFCVECPYATTLLGTYSKNTYQPTQNIFVDDEMVGDTINIFIQTVFNTDMGENEIVEDKIKVIIK
tara:strand:- start:455 stop:1186 length:732 start_codon:yes stop_codon:yes gene_type:complete